MAWDDVVDTAEPLTEHSIRSALMQGVMFDYVELIRLSTYDEPQGFELEYIGVDWLEHNGEVRRWHVKGNEKGFTIQKLP